MLLRNNKYAYLDNMKMHIRFLLCDVYTIQILCVFYSEIVLEITLSYFRTAIIFFKEKFYLLGRLKEEPILTADGITRGNAHSKVNIIFTKLKQKHNSFVIVRNKCGKMAK